MVAAQKVHVLSILDHVTKVPDSAYVETAIATACSLNNTESISERNGALVFWPTIHSGTTAATVIKHHRMLEDNLLTSSQARSCQ